MTMPKIILLVLIINTATVVGSSVINYSLFSKLQQADSSTGNVVGGMGFFASTESEEYTFFPVEKIIVSLRDAGREHYFVLDLVLQAGSDANIKKLEQIDPMVRSSVVAHLSAMSFSELRAMSITELQASLEQALLEDFSSKQLTPSFAHVLVSKLIVQ